MNNQILNPKKFITQIIYAILFLGLLLTFSCSSSTNNSNHSSEVSITQPSAGDTLTEPQTLITVEVTSEEFSGISFSIDDSIVIGSDNNAPYEFNWPNLYWADGETHTINVCFTEDADISDMISVIVSQEAKRHPNLIEPIDSVEIQNPIDFKWTSLPEVQQYHIYIQKVNNDTLPPIFKQSSDTTLTYSIPDHWGLGNFQWKVQAEQASGNVFSEWSPLSYFILVDSLVSSSNK